MESRDRPRISRSDSQPIDDLAQKLVRPPTYSIYGDFADRLDSATKLAKFFAQKICVFLRSAEAPIVAAITSRNTAISTASPQPV